MTSFNLMSQPWIKALSVEGEEVELSIRELFEQSHTLKQLANESPTVDFAITRILLAIMYRSCLPEESSDPLEQWQDMWNSHGFPHQAIAHYLDTWESRFDLFDQERPFMQVADLMTVAEDPWKNISTIVSDWPKDGALFKRKVFGDSISCAEAARWLIHCHAYDPAGIKGAAIGDPREKKGKVFGTLVGWGGWLGGHTIHGETLAHTLLLNLVVDIEVDPSDIPIWEDKLPLTQMERSPMEAGPFGPISLMTWPARRIRLLHDQGRVSKVMLCSGDNAPHTALHGKELMTGWRYSEPQTKKAKRVVYMPQTLNPDRALWRGLETLLHDQNFSVSHGKFGDYRNSLPSGVVRWVTELVDAEILPPTFALDLRVVSVEWGSQMSVIDTVVVDSLTFPALLASVSGDAHRKAACDAVEETDKATFALRQLAKNIVFAGGGDPEHAGDKDVAEAYSVFDAKFRSWLLTFNQDQSPGELLQAWREIARKVLAEIALDIVKAAPASAWKGREKDSHVVSVGQAEAWFKNKLYKALPVAQQETQSTESSD